MYMFKLSTTENLITSPRFQGVTICVQKNAHKIVRILTTALISSGMFYPSRIRTVDMVFPPYQANAVTWVCPSCKQLH